MYGLVLSLALLKKAHQNNDIALFNAQSNESKTRGLLDRTDVIWRS